MTTAGLSCEPPLCGCSPPPLWATAFTHLGGAPDFPARVKGRCGEPSRAGRTGFASLSLRGKDRMGVAPCRGDWRRLRRSLRRNADQLSGATPWAGATAERGRGLPLSPPGRARRLHPRLRLVRRKARHRLLDCDPAGMRRYALLDDKELARAAARAACACRRRVSPFFALPTTRCFTISTACLETIRLL